MSNLLHTIVQKDELPVTQIASYIQEKLHKKKPTVSLTFERYGTFISRDQCVLTISSGDRINVETEAGKKLECIVVYFSISYS